MAPKKPKEAKEADKDKAGEVGEVKPLEGEKGKYDMGSQKVEGSSKEDDKETGNEETVKEETHKITIKLKNDKNKPVSKMPSGSSVTFQIKVKGETYQGSLDDNGKAEITGLPDNPCEVSFPETDKKEWKKV